jgi:hypothetical protein
MQYPVLISLIVEEAGINLEGGKKSKSISMS